MWVSNLFAFVPADRRFVVVRGLKAWLCTQRFSVRVENHRGDGLGLLKESIFSVWFCLNL